MKKVRTSDITTSIGMPIKSGTLDHIQSAYIESIDALAKSIIGEGYSTSKVYILYGCKATTAAGVTTVTAGAVFANGEVYLVPAASLTVTGSNVIVGTVTTNFFTGVNADPVTFTDSTPRSVHEIRQMILSVGPSGSGTANFSAFEPTFEKWVYVSTPTQATIDTGSGTIASCTVTYKKEGNTVYFSYTISSVSGFTPSAGNNVWIDINLPFAADFTIAQQGIFSSAVAQLMTGATRVVGWAAIYNVTPAKIRLLFETNVALFEIKGQIFYPCTP
jgi:hypothetical protein